MKEQRMWAVVTRRGWIRTVAHTQHEAILMFLPRPNLAQTKQRWKDLKKYSGYRCVRVTVKEESIHA